MLSALQIACQPGGVIRQTMDECIQSAHELNKKEADARWINQHLHDSESRVEPLPNRQGNTPKGFSMTCGEFHALPTRRVNELLAFYNLGQAGSLEEKRSRLAHYFHLGSLIR